MRSPIIFEHRNPVHMESVGPLAGVWVHRDIPGMEHVADPSCWCCPLHITAEEMDGDGPDPMRLARFNWVN